jgi:hypothetical protein
MGQRQYSPHLLEQKKAPSQKASQRQTHWLHGREERDRIRRGPAAVVVACEVGDSGLGVVAEQQCLDGAHGHSSVVGVES